MARKEFSGGGRVWMDGALLGDATNISVTVGGSTTRINTTANNTGEIKSDPTLCKISIQHAVAKSGSDVLKIRRAHRASVDKTWKVQVGNNVVVARGKVSSIKMDAAPGKGDFSFEVEGDEQDPG